jgi:hypothetical protein
VAQRGGGPLDDCIAERVALALQCRNGGFELSLSAAHLQTLALTSIGPLLR